VYLLVVPQIKSGVKLSRKTVSVIMMLSLVLGTTGLVFDVQPVEASGTVYIRADGSVDPPSAPILRNGDLYTLTDNITHETADAAIVVEKNDIVFDGAGFAVKGQPWDRVSGSVGIYLNRTSNVTIQDVNFDNPYTGILLNSSSNNKINRNTMTRHDYGIWLDSSFNNSINGNTMTQSVTSIYLFSSSDNTIYRNTLTNTGLIRLNFSLSNSITRNNITNGYGGVRFDSSSNYNSLEENIVGSVLDGISLYDSSEYNIIRGNNITNNSLGGIMFDATSNHNSIYGNTIENNTVGIVPNYGQGWTEGNMITTNVAYGTSQLVSSNNTYYHNNIITNSQQVNTGSSGYVGVWDDGYPSGGNYWSDYDGTDTNHDGIGDTPYIIDADNTDNYPLINPWNHILGDVNYDGKVSLSDLVLLANAYGSHPGDTKWNLNADIDGNSIVGLSDLVVLAQHYGQHNP
jgi:parallel beta-helix repeat protein